MPEEKTQPTQLPLPGPTGVDPMALIRDANANAERVKGEAAKSKAEHEAKIAELEKSNAEARKQLDAIAKSKMDTVMARLDKLPEKEKALAAMVKDKLSADELSAYIDKIAPVAASDAPAPGAPRGTDSGDTEPDATMPSHLYKPEPALAKIYEQKTGQKIEHATAMVFTEAPGVRTFSLPLLGFRERIKTTRGQDATGKKSKY